MCGESESVCACTKKNTMATHIVWLYATRHHGTTPPELPLPFFTDPAHKQAVDATGNTLSAREIRKGRVTPSNVVTNPSRPSGGKTKHPPPTGK